MRKISLNILMIFIVATGCKKDNSVTYSIDSNASFIEWKGSTPKTSNNGTFSVSSSGIKVIKNRVTAGEFTIPISSLNVLNLTGDLKKMLTDHLKSESFFNIVLYDAASFKITSVVDQIAKPMEGVTEGSNTFVRGELTMLGVTKGIRFPAKIIVKDNKVEVEALLKINRLDWGMTYASDPDLGDNYIYPLVELHLKLTGETTRS